MRLGRRCAQLALAGLMAWALGLGAAAQVQAPAPPTLVVKEGQSATEIALDEVPPGTTMDQFLLALYQLNPQAFVAGDLNRLLAQARLVLPTAEQANRVPQAQAREELARIKGSAAAPASPAAQITPVAPALPSASDPASNSASKPAVAAAPAVIPDAAPAPVPAPSAPSEAGPSGLVWGLVLAALLALGFLMRRRPPAPTPPSSATPSEEQAQGRFQPVLPVEAPPAKAPAPAAAAPRPALFDLDLNLDGSAPPLDLPKPASLGKLPDLNLGSPAPRAATPGPLDLSGLSLDLDIPAPPKDKKP